MAITQAHIEKIKSLSKAFGASRLILFGSAVEDPEKARDVDIACDGVPGWKIFELAAKLELELHLPLDLVPLTPASSFTKYIEKNGKILL
jgi:predicted nucleotidyltransferase